MRLAFTSITVAFAVSLVASPLFAQNQAAAALASAGCGPDNVNFSVKTDKSQHPEGQPDAGKALVYIFEDEKLDPGINIDSNITTRVGLDGKWVGADSGKSYFFFSVDPGDHSLCADWQSSLASRSKQAGAASLSATAGDVYYFVVKVDARTHDQPALRVEPVDPAEAKILIASSSLSTSQPKK
jgi:hypothetical protein